MNTIESYYDKQANARFIPSRQQLQKYGPAAAGAVGGALLGGATGGWGSTLGLGALAGGLGLAYGLTPGNDLGEKLNTLKGYWNKFQQGGVNGLVEQWAASNPDKVRSIASSWMANNPEDAKHMAEQWAAANPDAVRNIASNWMTNNPEAAKRMAFQYMKDNPETRKEMTGMAATGLHKAVQGKGWLARTFGPSLEDIHREVDAEAERRINEATQVKQGSLSAAFAKAAGLPIVQVPTPKPVVAAAQNTWKRVADAVADEWKRSADWRRQQDEMDPMERDFREQSRQAARRRAR